MKFVYEVEDIPKFDYGWLFQLFIIRTQKKSIKLNFDIFVLLIRLVKCDNIILDKTC